uniref:Uncharacterized protein n=1 Tax=Arundo donax TaxID=35708 RepID=A0A0A9BTL7_ARUDO
MNSLIVSKKFPTLRSQFSSTQMSIHKKQGTSKTLSS